MAFVFVQSRAVERSLFPYAVMLQVTPVVAIAPLIIILVKDTRVALVACAALVALFPVISNTTLGLRTVDPGLANLFAVHKAGPLATLWRLRIPSALPLFFAGLRISSGLALIGAVVAEFVGGHRRPQFRSRLRDPPVGVSARHPAHVRGAVPHHRGRRPPCSCSWPG